MRANCVEILSSRKAPMPVRICEPCLLLRPIWHQDSGRTQAHIFVCVLAYALWKTLDHCQLRRPW